MRPIVIATGNPHKVEELAAILGLAGVPAVGLSDLADGPFPEPCEHGETFEANAGIKAVAYARATGRVCLSDDSGLEVDALGGRPGVISSHYCTDGREVGMSRAQRDAANNARVLAELAGVEVGRRGARFVCVMALATPEGGGRVLLTARGTMEGRIGLPGPGGVPRGAQGFGYDPIFVLPEPETRTGAELMPEEKNRVSHRAAAGRRLVELLRDERVRAALEACG